MEEMIEEMLFVPVAKRKAIVTTALQSGNDFSQSLLATLAFDFSSSIDTTKEVFSLCLAKKLVVHFVS